MFQLWKKCVDTGKLFDTLVKDYLTTFDYLDHELPRANLNAYGFTLSLLELHLVSKKN